MSSEEEKRHNAREGLIKDFKELRERQGLHVSEAQIRKEVSEIADRVDNKRRDEKR